MAFVPAAPLPRARRAAAATSPRMALDSATVTGVGAALLGLGGGVALLVWTESQGKRTEMRGNTQPCAECRGETIVTCTVCNGSGKDPLQKEVAEGAAQAPCTYCEGVGTLKCFNCAGSGIQPRFLDRYACSYVPSGVAMRCRVSAVC